MKEEMETMIHQKVGGKLVAIKEDREEVKQQQEHVISSEDNTEANSLPLPLAMVSCSDVELEKLKLPAEEADVARKKAMVTKIGRPLSRRLEWGDCQSHVVLLREALLSSAPDIAVLGPLHGCFSFYMTHLHNEVLSSSYARTMTFGANVTRLESAFMWVGGWRPTSALVLVYSLMGIEIEDALQAVRNGKNVVQNPATSLLSARQLSVMHTLQKHTQHAEMKISKKLSTLQMLIGDQDMLEAVMLDAASAVANDSSRFERVAEKRMSRLRRLLVQAEELRLHTLKDLLSLLTPIQAARCGVAVFEICSSLRAIGSRRLPATVPIIAMLPVILPISLPVPAQLVDTPSVVPTVVPSCSELLVSDTSSSQKFLNSSDIERLVSDASPSQDDVISSDRSLVPSRSSNYLSKLPQHPKPSSEDFNTAKRCHSSSSPALPVQEFSLNQTGEIIPSTGEEYSNSSGDEEGVISNRLLILSPSSSDVTVQSCSLESALLQPDFEMQLQLQMANDICDTGGQPQPEANGNRQSSGQVSNRMSAPSECAEQEAQPDLGNVHGNVNEKSQKV